MKFQDYIPFYRRNLTLALPIVLSQIGQVTVSLADNMMVGHVGTTELAAASFANSIFVIGMVFGMGITMGLTPLVGRAYGQNELHKAIKWLKNGVFTHFIASSVLMVLMFGIYFFLPYMGQPENVLHLARPYFLLLCSSYLPFMFFFSLKQFFEGIGNTKIAMQITLTANVINILVNYVLIFGKFGFPQMGLMGAGIGTLISRICMPLLFAWFILRNNRYRRYFVFAHHQSILKENIKALLRMGIPIGFQLIVEVAAFAIGAVMMGWLGETPLAAHQIALGLATLSYMVALGISQANTIRVSHQMGEKDYTSLKRAVYASTHLVLGIMSLSVLTFILARKWLPYLFTTDPEVIAVAAGLLIIAAVFQLFDGLQVVMQSSLRGMADVAKPMLISFIAYLFISIPTSYVLAFLFDIGPQGIWLGYLVGLGTAGILFYFRFKRLLKKLV
ncbi:MATE family efflux transporter [Draconibacterium sp. IB214405]|uniref:MATE family efflux transporter n=1 Tax=Draconibacterium sp. IB214405 TaxID=3097352 RepID=UPI002A129575|nr:MATE family efflux transporter [Draconibacterium sp. IB214405]MDX8339449.1 MATE family efflux transporter [Draconibacterium sp. IB214405]